MIVARRRATKSRAPNGTGCTRRALPAVYSRLLDFRFLGGPTGGAPNGGRGNEIDLVWWSIPNVAQGSSASGGVKASVSEAAKG